MTIRMFVHNKLLIREIDNRNITYNADIQRHAKSICHCIFLSIYLI